ncbi:hypothetical protein OCU04_004402 [Sclerotinia nivalis]|uniref:Uncharacterized protein n=1 Tax=Sclerotinia nivalis TaxID=352851 RepID=A0A9X0DMD2_9HELO|nr:hypothetical protein OCU04_004402 [Sclerotinia nivalis]
MPRNISRANTHAVAAAHHDLRDMGVVLAHDNLQNMIARVDPRRPFDAEGDARHRDHDLSNSHKRILSSCLQKEIHEHNDTRAKLHHMQAVLMTAEGNASSLNIYASELHKTAQDLTKRVNIAEEALHLSRVQLADAHQRIYALEKALHHSQMRIVEPQSSHTEHPDQDKIMLTIPVDVKGRSCTCTGRNSQEVINFMLRIPLEVDDGKCVCEGGSGPTIHEVHGPTLTHLGMSVDYCRQKSTSREGQISPLSLDGNTRDMANPSAENVHTLHTQRIDLVNHVLQTSTDNSVSHTQIIKGNQKTDIAAPKLRATTDNAAQKHGLAIAGPSAAVAVNCSGSTSIQNGNTTKSPESNSSDCIEITENVNRSTPRSQSIVNIYNLTVATTSASEHKNPFTSGTSCEIAQNQKNKRKILTIDDITSWGASQTKQSKLD